MCKPWADRLLEMASVYMVRLNFFSGTAVRTCQFADSKDAGSRDSRLCTK
jgi:hypothetical protein